MRAAGVLLLAAAWLPSLIASLITVADIGGDHEFRCARAEDGFELTLHHPAAIHHHHTLLERVLIGAADDGEPDHHLWFSLSHRFNELPGIEMPPTMAELPAHELGVALPQPKATRTALIPREAPVRAPPPPWRRVVMTI